MTYAYSSISERPQESQHRFSDKCTSSWKSSYKDYPIRPEEAYVNCTL